MGADGQDAARVTATLTRQQFMELKRICDQHGVSQSWFVRRSVERALEQATGGPLLPLELAEQGKGGHRRV
jgi:hypothetical protein